MGSILRVLNMTEKCFCRNKDTGSHAELVQGVAMVSNMVVGVPTAMTVWVITVSNWFPQISP